MSIILLYAVAGSNCMTVLKIVVMTSMVVRFTVRAASKYLLKETTSYLSPTTSPCYLRLAVASTSDLSLVGLQ